MSVLPRSAALHPADDLQIRIMKELASPSSFRWDVRESYARIAEKLGVDEETVRRRVKQVEQLGFLRRWQILLNPHLIGRESAGLDLEVDDEERKPTIISQMKLLDGIVFIIDLHGKGLRAVFYHEGEEDFTRKTKLVSSLAGAEKPLIWKGGLPESDLKLKRTDWEIIKALRKNPRRSLSEIAREVKVSTRTVRRRLEMMTDGKAFFLMVTVNPSRGVGLACNYLIFCPEPRKKNEVDKKILSSIKRVFFSFTEGKDFSIFVIICNNMTEAEETSRWIRELAGVEDIRMGVMKDFILVPEWLDQEIERKLSTTIQATNSPA